MTSLRPRLAAAALLAAATAFVAAGTSVALATAFDPIPPPEPLVGPLAVEPKYQDLAKLQDKVLGPMAIEPAKGNFATLMNFTTAGGCPRGSNTVTKIYGPKLPEGGQNIIGNNYTYDFGSPPAGQIKAQSVIDLAEVVSRQPKAVVLDGVYRIWMQCQGPDMDDFSVNYGVFEGKLRIHKDTWTALTELADLPEKPTPKAGPEAYYAFSEYQNPKPVPTPLADPLTKSLQDLEKSAASKSGAGSSTALAATGGIVALGLIPLGFVWMRRRRPAAGKK